MPTTRKSSGSTRARPGPGRGQSTISFSNRVSKPGTRQDAKKAVLGSGKKAEDVVTAREESVPATVEIELEPEAAEEKPEVEEAEDEEVVQAPEKSAAELTAEKLTHSQINKYWAAIEAQRIAPRVHVDDVSTEEKVLRYFDVSSQYGPCVGISRLRRWQRADKLGLGPPIEVLSVLLKEEEKGSAKFQQAHMDEILNSTAVGA